MSVTTKYSGLVINQNALSSGSIVPGSSLLNYDGGDASSSGLLILDGDGGTVLDGGNAEIADFGTIYAEAIYQDFFLPVDYERGPDSTPEIPALSGIQLMMQATDLNVTALWGIDHLNSQGSWDNLTQNTLEQVPYVGSFIWAQMTAPTPITIDPAWLNDRFRLWTVFSAGISALFYVAPNPLASFNVCAYANSDGTGIFTDDGNEVSMNFRVSALSADSGTDILGNQFRAVVIPKAVEAVNPVDGDPNIQWMSRPNPSKFAIEALYADMSQDGEPVVVDSILLDPITPNMTFNVYYSSDGDPAIDASDWDSKLWTRVPMVYTARKRDTYYLPRPATAKFFKIEMTNLQSQQYRTKVVQPVQYQRFPSWVLTYFLAQYEASRISEDYLISPATNVVFDLLDYAYSYTLDGIDTGPELPVSIQVQQQLEFQEQLTQDLSQVDQTTLQNISTALLPFSLQPTDLSNNNSLLGQIASQATAALSTLQAYPQERIRPSYIPLAPYTSSRLRDPLMQQKQQPDMYFFATCRHTYRKATAKFTNDRAYFAGVRELAFLRDNYNIPRDTPVYWEVFGDGFNQIT
jgi:hypothetical protein